MLDTIESIVKIFFYIAAPSAAWVALFTWSRELKGKAKHDVAKDLLVLVIQIRSFLTAAQFHSKFVSSRQNKIKKYEWIKDYFSKTSVLCTEVKVHFKKDEPELVNELLRMLVSLDFIVCNYDPKDLLEGYSVEESKVNLEIIDGNNTEFNRDAEDIFVSIENKFRKYV
ncbi:hypothetical protein [Moritella sp.]|uniref:hypothetical protein n=1 Tax=Moritella sp. TaxID=78556 RepID=UPI0025E4710B|nr:hypothetical protein [Moritella sp.]MCJ8348290.1 hypothetical protein [Moritella sp.]